MKKNKLLVVIISIFGLAAILTITLFSKKKDRTELITSNPGYGNITKTITATGTLQPVDTVAVGAQVSGTIKNIFVDFNSVVKKGQLLAQLDPVVLQSQEQQAVANLQQAIANLEYQASNYNRQQQLYNAEAISKADLETATYQYQAAQENVRSNQSQLRAAQKNLSFTGIYSPINGTVLSRNVSAGQTVAASFNTPILFSIANDLSRMELSASVDEADIGSVKAGQKVSFTVDAYPDVTFIGNVEEIRLEPIVSFNVVTYTTMIKTNNANLMLKPGMTANITIITEEEDDVLLIPQSATQFVPNPSLSKNYVIIPMKTDSQQQLDTNNYSSANTGKNLPLKSNVARVWIEKGDTLIEKQITTGISNEVQDAVITGLGRGDVVVTGINNLMSSGNKTTQERSPFMPASRGGNNKTVH